MQTLLGDSFNKENVQKWLPLYKWGGFLLVLGSQDVKHNWATLQKKASSSPRKPS